MLFESIARHSLVVSRKLSARTPEGFRSSPGNLSITCAMPFRATDEVCPMEKVLVDLWGVSITVEGDVWALGAAIVIVGIVAVVVARRLGAFGKP
jgi:hypothetical protein